MNQPNPQKIHNIRLFLRLIQAVLVVILLVVIWSNATIELWQKLLATGLGLLLFTVHSREFLNRRHSSKSGKI